VSLDPLPRRADHPGLPVHLCPLPLATGHLVIRRVWGPDARHHVLCLPPGRRLVGFLAASTSGPSWPVTLPL